MAVLTAKDLEKFSGVLDTKDVFVPKWGGTVKVREMTISEFELHTAAQAKTVDDGQASARLLVKVLVDDTGTSPLFADDERSVRIIANLGLKEINLLMGAVNDLSGLDDDEAGQAEKDMEIAGESGAQTSSSS